MNLIIEVFLMGLAVALASYIVPGAKVDGFFSAIIAGLLIAVANATVGFLLRILTFPINILTLGLMSFVISVLMILLVSNIMSGFHVSGFMSATIFAIVLAIIKMIFKGLGSNS